MLTQNTIKKIEDFISVEPRSVNEIATHIIKNWRTADRYIREIEESLGSVTTKVFRKGTRGALKIVYPTSIDKISSTAFQEKMEKQILLGREKEDFSAFDIYQHVPEKLKQTQVEYKVHEGQTDLAHIVELLKNTKKELLMFSGNLSFINLKDKNHELFKVIEELVKKGIKIKIACRVDIAGKENVEKMLSLNFKHAKENIEIRHTQTPLRAIIFDKKILSIKEIKEPTGKINELNKKIFLFYTIKDKSWVDWSTRIFNKIFHSSIDANKRLTEINRLNL
ncbi:hypothetical protein GOV14_05430 [Candidatus Pacearchaeota archaeon]|nr:hypothetical protein [Candidatus Pacearchaeota archaeon]